MLSNYIKKKPIKNNGLQLFINTNYSTIGLYANHCPVAEHSLILLGALYFSYLKAYG
jgi:hypothetical protein